MKGIILAGGSGTRLYPLTMVTSKQLLPIYDKPMICYPLSTLMLLGVRDILIISTPQDTPMIENFLGDGSQFGLSLTYEVQHKPRGIAEALLIGEEFIGGDTVCLILGDNIFNFVRNPKFLTPDAGFTGARIVGYHVHDPERFGIIEMGEDHKVISLIEKPEQPKSSYAAVGLYFYDHTAVEKTRKLSHSDRGELEITDLNNEYLSEGQLSCSVLPRGSLWMDAGTVGALNTISNYIRSVEEIQNLKISCVEEVAFRLGLVDNEGFLDLLRKYKKDTPYHTYLRKIYDETV